MKTMRTSKTRRAGVLVLALVSVGAVSASAGAAPPRAAVAPPATLRPGTVGATVKTCHTGPAAADRFAVFSAQMAALRGTSRMAVRFALFGSPDGSEAGEHRLSAPGLGVWNRSAPGVTIFAYDQTVEQLPYGRVHAVISYRWYDRRGRVTRRDRRVTPMCAQPDLRPRLVAGAVTRTPQADGRTEYGVTVTNRGLGASPAFTVALSVAGTPVGSQTIAGLDAGQATVATFTAPRCPSGESLVVTLDPEGRVDQPSRDGDTRTVACA